VLIRDQAGEAPSNQNEVIHSRDHVYTSGTVTCAVAQRNNACGSAGSNLVSVGVTNDESLDSPDIGAEAEAQGAAPH